MGIPLQFIECWIYDADRIHITIRNALERRRKIVRVLSLVNKGPLASSLPAGVDRFLGDRYADLGQGIAQAKSFSQQPRISADRADETGIARRIDLRDRTDTHQHVRCDDLVHYHAMLVIALFNDR